jgi:hypothetical protein
MATRYLKFTGTMGSDTATADILINNQLVYAGIIGEGVSPTPLTAQPPEASELITVEWGGIEDAEEIVSIVIDITEGIARIGPIKVDVIDENGDTVWIYPNSETAMDDGRVNILVDGAPSPWPKNPPANTKGTADNPDWAGWCFDVEPVGVFSCDYTILPKIYPDIVEE